jgi:hypothetical protein
MHQGGAVGAARKLFKDTVTRAGYNHRFPYGSRTPEMRLFLSIFLFVIPSALAAHDSDLVDAGEEENQEAHPNDPVSDSDPWWMSEDRYPQLPTGDVGELPEGAEAEKRTWDRKLPFMAQQVIDLGFELPNPYGAGGIFAHVEQEIVLSDLRVAINNGPKESIEFVDFGRSFVENNTVQARMDAWILPFLNLYGIVGKFDGEGEVPLGIPGDELLKYLLPEVGQSCDRPPGSPLRPQICDKIITTTAFPNYVGYNIGIGITLAMGWRNYFVAIPMTYVVTDVDIVDTNIDTLQVSPRIGFTIDTQDRGQFAFYAGGSWMEVELDLTGRITLPTSEFPEFDEDVTIDFAINQVNADAWNYVAGFNWDMSSTWAVQAEIGFGGSRDHFITSLTYRF